MGNGWKKSGVPRDQIFVSVNLFRSSIEFETDLILKITSKLWNTHHHPKNVEEALNKTLKDLQTDYLDLYLVCLVVSLLRNVSNKF